MVLKKRSPVTVKSLQRKNRSLIFLPFIHSVSRITSFHKYSIDGLAWFGYAEARKRQKFFYNINEKKKRSVV